MELKIMGHKYKVIYDSELAKRHSKDGSMNANLLEIAIDSHYPTSRSNETLLHEIIEALNYHLSLELEHNKISALSEGLFQVLNDNGIWNGGATGK